MNGRIHQLEQYIREALGISVAPHPWEHGSRLPQYLRDLYRFFKMDMLGTECVLMVEAGEAERTPAVIGKHLGQVRSRHNAEVVYVRDAITSYNRKRLIDHKIPFIVSGHQMYLPMLGIDLREHLRRLREKKPVFSPATQALLLYILWQKRTDAVRPAEIARRLGYTAMTMTRAFGELEMAGIGEHAAPGRARYLRFAEMGKPLWGKVLPYMSSPVKRRLYVASPLPTDNGVLAGLSALARYTKLSEPAIPVLAFSANEWTSRMRQGETRELAMPEPGAFEIELWTYPPGQFALEGTVDRLSLYLSLRDSADERVQSALAELLGGMEW